MHAVWVYWKTLNWRALTLMVCGLSMMMTLGRLSAEFLNWWSPTKFGSTTKRNGTKKRTHHFWWFSSIKICKCALSSTNRFCIANSLFCLAGKLKKHACYVLQLFSQIEPAMLSAHIYENVHAEWTNVSRSGLILDISKIYWRWWTFSNWLWTLCKHRINSLA